MVATVNQLTGFGYKSGLGAASSSYVAEAVEGDGSTIYLKDCDGTGLTNGKKGLLSIWFYPETITGTPRLFNSGDTTFQVVFTDTRIRIIGKIFSGVKYEAYTTYTLSQWNHVIFAWDLSAGVNQTAVNGSQTTPTDTTTLDSDLDYSENYSVFAINNGSSKSDSSLAELYFNPVETLDLSVQANIDKFISGGKPIDLGSDGSTPTGTQPAIYLKNPLATWQNNLGSLGNFTEVGTLLASSNGSPSD